ncbi:MAG TPA: OB-fold domain-containing protein [Burkholderiales bacterium]|nr:OB-fold domain-containing protein [Burkholderiales bacterium]
MTAIAQQDGAAAALAAVERGAPVAAGAFTRPNDQGAIRLIGQRCRDCGARFFPGGRASCIRCYGAGLEAVELDDTGTVDCFTVVRQAPKGYHGPVPYVIGNVVLGGDVWVLAQLVGKDPEAWRCGEPVVACAFPLPRDAEHRGVALCYGFRPLAPGQGRLAAGRAA